MDALTTTETTPVQSLRDALFWLKSYDHGDAASLADNAIDAVIAVLPDDPRMPKLGQIEWELLLEDARAEIAGDIADVIEGTVNFGEVEDAVNEAFSEDDGEEDDE
jgi:hypothetical protein